MQRSIMFGRMVWFVWEGVGGNGSRTTANLSAQTGAGSEEQVYMQARVLALPNWSPASVPLSFRAPAPIVATAVSPERDGRNQ